MAVFVSRNESSDRLLGSDLAPYPIEDISQHHTEEGDANESEGGGGQWAVVEHLTVDVHGGEEDAQVDGDTPVAEISIIMRASENE